VNDVPRTEEVGEEAEEEEEEEKEKEKDEEKEEQEENEEEEEVLYVYMVDGVASIGTLCSERRRESIVDGRLVPTLNALLIILSMENI
jgi:TATA-binding protein-associated factor Taf7